MCPLDELTPDAQPPANNVQIKIPILPVISHYVTLRKHGKQHSGVCPLHNDKGPSLSVSETKNAFYCFGCHQKGGPVQFVMAKENLSYAQALKRACELAGVDVPQNERYLQPKETDPRLARLIELNRRAVGYYRLCLIQAGGQHARAYVQARNLDAKAFAFFGIGYAPATGHSLYDVYKGQDLLGSPTSLGDLIDAGLGIDNKERPDFFVDRLMLVIHDADGDPIGFAGRALNPHVASKYINTPETALFKKERVLYNWHRAKAALTDGLLWLCEGYFDVIALYTHSIINAVALMGTNLSNYHIAYFKKTPSLKKVVLTLDQDAAGKNATIKCARMLLAANIAVSVFLHPEPGCKDIDELLQKKPHLTAEQLVTYQQNYFAFFATTQSATINEQNRAEAIGPAATAVATEIKMYADEFSWPELAKTCAAILQIDADTLYARIKSVLVVKPRMQWVHPDQNEWRDINVAAFDYEPPMVVKKRETTAVNDLRARIAYLQQSLRAAENRLVYVFINYPESLTDFDQMLCADLDDGWFARIFKRLAARARRGETVSLAQLPQLSQEAAGHNDALRDEYLQRAQAVMTMGQPTALDPDVPRVYRPDYVGNDAKQVQQTAIDLELLTQTKQSEQDSWLLTGTLNSFMQRRIAITNYVDGVVQQLMLAHAPKNKRP